MRGPCGPGGSSHFHALALSPKLLSSYGCAGQNGNVCPLFYPILPGSCAGWISTIFKGSSLLCSSTLVRRPIVEIYRPLFYPECAASRGLCGHSKTLNTYFFPAFSCKKSNVFFLNNLNGI